ncbi:helix-turn-helix domain-containing protein [Glaesserella parasuis]|nr:helix-turn-helix domain-containing protein [Glaesserella parasuis]MDP0247775.1 helix-turn-helix domain-containing protein [Glaesserella parasuis]
MTDIATNQAEKTALINMNTHREAQLKYWAGYSLTEIAKMLNIPVSTIASWKKREKWDEASLFERVSGNIESRYMLLLQKDVKTGYDFKELDFLMHRRE